jgi:hypothetical protein
MPHEPGAIISALDTRGEGKRNRNPMLWSKKLQEEFEGIELERAKIQGREALIEVALNILTKDSQYP